MTDTKKIIETICQLYGPLPPECKTEILNTVRFLDLKKDTTLVREGQYADKTYFIVNGCARAYYLKDGKDVSDWFAFESDFISSVNSFFLNVPSPHYIELLEDSLLLEFSRADTNEWANKYHEFERLSKNIITKAMLQQQERIVSMQFHSAQEKYENLLSIQPNIDQRVPLTHIASYIGITLETLSRIRHPKSRI